MSRAAAGEPLLPSEDLMDERLAGVAVGPALDLRRVDGVHGAARGMRG